MDEILRFVEFWEGADRPLARGTDLRLQKLTTYANLSKLNQMGIPFITLRRRTKKLLDEVAKTGAVGVASDRTEEPLACRSDAARPGPSRSGCATTTARFAS